MRSEDTVVEGSLTPVALQATTDKAQEKALNEVAPLPVDVQVREYVEAGATLPDGSTATRRTVVEATHTIESYVPARIFNRMVATQKKAYQARQKWLDTVEPDERDASDDPALIWQQQQIWNVWKLTEPDMTLERLQEGLDIVQVQGLFARFFTSYLARMKSDL